MVFSLGFVPGEALAQNTYIKNFTRAKLFLKQAYSGAPTIYCGCEWSKDTMKIDPDGCDYQPKKVVTRSYRVEWEHLVPASRLGAKFVREKQSPRCVDSHGKRYRGRKCLEKVSPEFNHMEADMYNLRPAAGGLNGLRSDYPYGEVEGEPRDFGPCNFEFDHEHVEFRDEVRGEIARAYLYMASAYPDRIQLSDEEQKQFEEWNLDYPATEEECKFAERVARFQKNSNPFVHCPAWP